MVLDLLPKYLPGTLNVAEIFLTASVNAAYVCFGADSLLNRETRVYIAGNNS
jgi:hypothetical protein